MDNLKKNLQVLVKGASHQLPRALPKMPDVLVGQESAVSWTDGLGGNGHQTNLQNVQEVSLTMVLGSYPYQPPDVIPGQPLPVEHRHYELHPLKHVYKNGVLMGSVAHIKQCTALDEAGTPIQINFSDDSTDDFDDLSWTYWHELNQ